MDSKAYYYGTCLQEIYNKRDDFRQINVRLVAKYVYGFM